MNTLPLRAETAAPDAWLHALAVLLHALRPRALALVPSPPPTQRRTIERLDAEAARCAGLAPGWLFGLGDGNGTSDGSTLALHVATDQVLSATDRRVLLGSALGRLAWRLHAPDAQYEPAAADPLLADAVHALRNGLNSTVMNTAVLAACAHEMPAALEEATRRVEQAAARSAVELHRLMALIEARA